MQLLKNSIRKEIKYQKSLRSSQELQTLSDALFANLEEYALFSQSVLIACYHSLPDEVNTHSFLDRWGGEKQFLLPLIQHDELFFCPYVNQQITAGTLGIQEPTTEPFTALKTIDLILIPGVAFDPQGNRLGRGKGYYDRFLKQVSAPKIGICFDFQVIDAVPVESFDVKMDGLCTESGFWLF